MADQFLHRQPNNITLTTYIILQSVFYLNHKQPQLLDSVQKYCKTDWSKMIHITRVDKNDIITGRIDFYWFATAQYSSKPCIIIVILIIIIIRLFSHDKSKIHLKYNVEDKMYLVTKVAIKRKSHLR